MKKSILLIFVLISTLSFAQEAIESTSEFTISGRVQKEINFSLADLSQFEDQPIADLVITNHLGIKKGTSQRMSGIPIKTILENVKFDVESPKVLSELYFVFEAIDGYKAVYSWNEIYNSSTGENIYLVTQKDGKMINEMEDRILVICTSDFKTGRRNLKGLSKIRIERVD